MEVFYLECKLDLPWVHSLKEKRMAVRRVIDSTRHQFNVSVAEADRQDVWQTAVVAIVGLAADARLADRYMDTILRHVDAHCEGDVVVQERLLL